MEKFQNLQSWCQIGIFLFSFLAALCGYGSYYFGMKKDLIKEQKELSINNLSNKDSIIKNADKDNSDIKRNIINAPSAYIVTQDQSGGNNTVNIYSNPNPANRKNKPIFSLQGRNGPNILHFSNDTFIKDSSYSLNAKIPDNSKLFVTIKNNSSDESSLWVIDVFSNKNWTRLPYKDGEQTFKLEDAEGDLKMIYRGTGSAILKITFNNELINSKTIKWQ